VSRDESALPRLPEAVIGGNVQGPVVVCILSRPTLEFVWTRDNITYEPIPNLITSLTGAAVVDFNATGINGKSQAPRLITEGDYNVTIPALDADNYLQGIGAQTFHLNRSFHDEIRIVLTKLAKPTFDVGWGAARVHKVGSIRITLTRLADSITVDTIANGTAAFPRTRGLIPGQYVVSLPRSEDRKLYRLDTATVDLVNGQTTVVGIQLTRLVRPRIRIVNDANNEAIAGVPVTLLAGNPPSSPRRVVLRGVSKASGSVELATNEAGLVPGPYTVEIEADPFNATLVSAAATQLDEGPHPTIPKRATVTRGVLVIEVSRHDGQTIRPLEGQDHVIVTTKVSTATDAVEIEAREVTSQIEKEAGRLATVRKAVATHSNRLPGNYEVGIKDVLPLRLRQDNQYSISTPNWRIGPNATGKMTVTVEAGKTTTASFTLVRYKKVQFVGFNIMPGTQKGFRCVTCGSFSATAGHCSSIMHGLRAKFICNGHTPPLADVAAGPHAGHFQELTYLCGTCGEFNDSQGACTKPGCGGLQCWPYCPTGGHWFGNTICVPCGGAGAARRFPIKRFSSGRCQHAVPVTFPGAIAACTKCLRQYAQPESYLGFNNSEHDLGARCFIMKKAIQAAYASDNIKKGDSGKAILKIFMGPEFYFRNTDGGYPVELLASIIEQMRDETSKVQYKDWLFVYGSAIGYLKHESAAPPNANSAFPFRITQVIPGATTRLHIARRTDGWASPDICDRIPPNNAALTPLSQWNIKQGVGPNITVNAYRRIATKAVEVEIVQIGQLGVMTLKWRIGTTGNWSPDITSTASGVNDFAYEIPGHPCTVVFPQANYVLNSTYVLAQDGTRTGTGGFAVTTRNHAALPSPLEIVIERAGTLGTMRFTWNFNAVAASAPVASVQHNAFTLPIHEAGQRLFFAPNNYAVGTYAVATNGTVIRTPLGDTAVTALPLCGMTCPRTADPSAAEYEIEVTAGTWAAGDCELVEPKATEVFNVVLVQKGGADAGVSGLRELLVYKEYVSHIDFLGPNGNYELFHRRSGLGRAVAIHNNLTRALLPTSGSRDLLAVKPNPQSGERTKTGLGGGSVFTIDGVTFGLEVCLDHAKNKLYDFYKPTAPPTGTPKVQVHLIPSWGMSIDQGNRVGVPGARIFNVDGPAGSFAGKLGNPDIQDPVDSQQGQWLKRDNDGWIVALPALPTAPNPWPIKTIDPASLRRTALSPAANAPFPLIDYDLAAPAGGIGRFFEKKDPNGTTLAAYGNIKIFPAKDLPEAETI
jgi:hypothetical protein